MKKKSLLKFIHLTNLYWLWLCGRLYSRFWDNNNKQNKAFSFKKLCNGRECNLVFNKHISGGLGNDSIGKVLATEVWKPVLDPQHPHINKLVSVVLPCNSSAWEWRQVHLWVSLTKPVWLKKRPFLKTCWKAIDKDIWHWTLASPCTCTHMNGHICGWLFILSKK